MNASRLIDQLGLRAFPKCSDKLLQDCTRFIVRCHLSEVTGAFSPTGLGSTSPGTGSFSISDCGMRNELLTVNEKIKELDPSPMDRSIIGICTLLSRKSFDFGMQISDCGLPREQPRTGRLRNALFRVESWALTVRDAGVARTALRPPGAWQGRDRARPRLRSASERSRHPGWNSPARSCDQRAAPELPSS